MYTSVIGRKLISFFILSLFMPAVMYGITISGLIYHNGTPLPGVTVTFGTYGSATTDQNGYYLMYTLPTPVTVTTSVSKAGYTFSPSSKTYTNVATNQTNQGYNATILTYTISGNTGVDGVTLTKSTGGSTTSDASGNYTFTVNYGWTGTITPSKAGYTFSPASRTYTNILSNQTGQSYTSAVQTFTISGTVNNYAGTGVPGVSISFPGVGSATTNPDGIYSISVPYDWSGTATPSKTDYSFSPTSTTFTNVRSNSIANFTGNPHQVISGNTGLPGVSIGSTTSDGFGSYSIKVPWGWTGTLTPTRLGYTFTPSSRTYNNVVTAQTGQNYTSAILTFTISGNAGISGATLTASNGGGSATSGADGSYSLTVNYGWNGTVTPTKAGYDFNPVNKPYTNVTSNQSSQNYSAALQTRIIQGSVYTTSADEVPGVTISFPGVGNAVTNAGGFYSISVPYGWSGTATPSKTDYSFSPASTSFTNVTSTQNANFTGNPHQVISGNTGVGGVTIGSTTSDASGNYSLKVAWGWSGTLTPSKAGYTFSPGSKSYSNVMSSQSSQNYTATLQTRTISGNVGVVGATLTLSTGGSVTSDMIGNYSITVNYGWTGTITPSKPGYTFNPPSIFYPPVDVNRTDQNYSATLQTVTITGNAGLDAIITFSNGGGSTTADPTGNYSIQVPYGWSGTATPSKTSFIFTPPTRSYTNVTSAQTGQNYTPSTQLFIINGYVTDNHDSDLEGVTLTFSNGAGSDDTDGGGYYMKQVPYGWSGRVTPSKPGYDFVPAYIDYTNVTSNPTYGSYIGTLQTVGISGNAGIDATITFSNGGGSTTAAPTGNYSISVPYGWSGTATPSKAGYTFTPVNRSYTNVTSSQSGQNYTPAIITYTISGNTSIGGVTLTKSTGGSVTSDASGNYSITVNHGWSGRVTPSKSGYDFSPPYRDYTNVTSNQSGQDYTATLQTFPITGTTIPFVSIDFPGVGTAQSGPIGTYGISVPYGWSGTATPSKSGISSFSPPNRVYNNVTSGYSGQDYSAYVTISGSTGTGGATLTISTGGSLTADSSGNYVITVSYGWTGTITPSKTGHTFSPVNKQYTVGITSNQSQNFAATLQTFPITGTTAPFVSIDFPGVGPADSGPMGTYGISVPYGWSGTATPSKADLHSFSPESRTYENVTSAYSNQDYSAFVSISGNAGTSGVILTLSSGEIDTSDALGNYVFIVGYGWTGTVTPSKTGHTFSPVNKQYTVGITSNQSQNFAATLQTFPITGTTAPFVSIDFPGVGPADSGPMGNYGIYVPYGWSGTATPSKADLHSFSPESRTYENVTSAYSNQDYLAFVSISGNADTSGVILTLSSGEIDTSDALGNYTFIVEYGWTGTITPLETGHTFSPPIKPYTIGITSNQSQNFTAIPIPPTISGNAGTGGATLTISTGGSVTADSIGNYSITVSGGWTGTITPLKPGYDFSPPYKSFTNVNSNQSQNFTATLQTFPITGTTAPFVSIDFPGVGPADSGPMGNYGIYVPYGWSGTATPSKADLHSFSPESRTYENVTSAYSNQDYLAFVSISGNADTSGVILTLSSGEIDTSDALGNYTFIVEYGWTGTITPSMEGHFFSPPTKPYTIGIVSNKDNQNFALTSPPFIERDQDTIAFTDTLYLGANTVYPSLPLSIRNSGGITASGRISIDSIQNFRIVSGVEEDGIFTISPAEELTITVEFRPNSWGAKTGTITIDGDSLTNDISIPLTGFAYMPILVFNPPVVNKFPRATVGGKSDTVSFRIKNIYPGTAKGRVVITGTDSLQYKIVAIGNRLFPESMTDASDTISLRQDDSLFVKVFYKPVSADSHYAKLSILETNANLPYVELKAAPLGPYSRYYYVKDHLGSVRMTVDEDGEVVSAQNYHAFGAEVSPTINNSDPNAKYKFTEKERDRETEYDYFGARYYDPDLGRWLSVDPLSDLRPGLSPYNYVQNNPLSRIDPSGMLDTEFDYIPIPSHKPKMNYVQAPAPTDPLPHLTALGEQMRTNIENSEYSAGGGEGENYDKIKALATLSGTVTGMFEDLTEMEKENALATAGKSKKKIEEIVNKYTGKLRGFTIAGRGILGVQLLVDVYNGDGKSVCIDLGVYAVGSLSGCAGLGLLVVDLAFQTEENGKVIGGVERFINYYDNWLKENKVDMTKPSVKF